MDIKKLIEDTRLVNAQFKSQMDKKARMLDLVEEVGELAQAILMVEGDKTSGNPLKKRTKSDIADALADILYDLIILADAYEVDLPEEYSAMLKEMEKRFASGDLIKK